MASVWLTKRLKRIWRSLTLIKKIRIERIISKANLTSSNLIWVESKVKRLNLQKRKMVNLANKILSKPSSRSHQRKSSKRNSPKLIKLISRAKSFKSKTKVRKRSFSRRTIPSP